MDFSRYRASCDPNRTPPVAISRCHTHGPLQKHAHITGLSPSGNRPKARRITCQSRRA